MSDSTRPRILLLGSQGQLGYELRRSLRPLGELVAAARKPEPGERAVDLSDHAGLAQLIRDVRPAVVVNAGAYTLVDQAEKEPNLAAAINAVAPGVIQATAREMGAAAVHYSTDYVFDGSGSEPRDEAAATAPLSAYGTTKRAGEEAIENAGGAYVVLRTSWVYGVHGVNFVKKILKLARDRELLRIVADQVGAPTTAGFLADSTAQILTRSAQPWSESLAAAHGIYHACCGGDTSWYGFTCAIVERARRAGLPLAVKSIEPITSAEFPTPARRPLNSRLSCRRLSERFGITPPGWEAALDETLPRILKEEFGV